MSDNKKIRFRFDGHGLGDCVHCAMALQLYLQRGYDVAIQVEPNKRWLWEAAGIPIYEPGRDGPDLPLHPYYYPGGFFDLSAPDYTNSKIAHLFEVDPNVMPVLGTKEEVWQELCQIRVNLVSAISSQAFMEASAFVEDLPRPIFVLHSRGTNWAAEKSIPTETAFNLILELLDNTPGSVVVLDYDRRAPMVGDARCKGIKPSWGHIGIDRLCALLLTADLFIGIDSGPFHVASMLGVKSIFVGRQIPPVRCCLPSPNATYLVPARDHEHWAKRDSRWRFAEFQGEQATSQDIVTLANQILSGPKELAPLKHISEDSVLGNYTYRRVGHDERRMVFWPDGKIGEGAAGCERVWKIEQTPVGPCLTIYGDHGGSTCHLQREIDGVFRGRWLNHERMPIELVPLEPYRGGTPTGAADIEVGTRPIPISGFAVGIPTLNRFDLLSKCIDAVLAGSLVPDVIYVIDNSGGKWEGHPSPRVKVIVPPYNLGCARSWNLLMSLVSPMPLVILSDDVYVGRNTCESLVTCDAGFVVADGSHAMMAFMIRPEAWSTIGPFDEVFWPIYHEDNDYCRRAFVAGVDMVCPANDGFIDCGPSATKQALSAEDEAEWNRMFDICRQYYLSKWGGLPHQESYHRPFNGDLSRGDHDLRRTNAEIIAAMTRKAVAE